MLPFQRRDVDANRDWLPAQTMLSKDANILRCACNPAVDFPYFMKGKRKTNPPLKIMEV
jgi:hypothetical protein